MNVAPLATHPVFQCVLRGHVVRDLPVPIGMPTVTPVVNVFNYECLSVSGAVYAAIVAGVTGLGASFYTQVFALLKAALNQEYIADSLYVRSLTDPAFIPQVYLNDGAAGHVIATATGAIMDEAVPMNAAVTMTVVFTGGRGNNGKLRKSFGPLSASDMLTAPAPLEAYASDRINVAVVVGGTGINWLNAKPILTNTLSDGVQTFTPYLFSRNQSTLVPVSGPPIIRGWSLPGSPTVKLNLTVGSLRHRIEKGRPTA